ncbi:hypothetical protein CKA32_004734 [Geitlerinema sp. FC II]|nr:hypothetical protein CKA32_004734 [Geitlerinema sp. FC II]
MKCTSTNINRLNARFYTLSSCYWVSRSLNLTDSILRFLQNNSKF